MANPNKPGVPGAKGAAPKGPRTIWDNPIFTMVLAIILGFVTWTIVTVFIDPQGSKIVANVPINYTSGASTYTAQSLDIVEKPDIEGVTVKVEGNSTIIGNIQNSDIMVYPSYAGVSGAGKVTLRLQARVTNTTDFPGDIDCTVESPETIDVVFDEVSEKTIPVTVDCLAVAMISTGYDVEPQPPPCIRNYAAAPDERAGSGVQHRGPGADRWRAGRHDHSARHAGTARRGRQCVHTAVHLDGQRLRQCDADGIPGARLPLEVDFIGTPNGFDVESLHCSLSQQTLKVAGPARTIGTLESLTVTDFDLAREFEPGRDYQRLIELPAGIVSLGRRDERHPGI